MAWLPDTAGTVTEWAVELTYSDGERRYKTDGYDEAEARREAEIAVLEAMHRGPSDSYPVSARAVSRQVTYTVWSA